MLSIGFFLGKERQCIEVSDSVIIVRFSVPERLWVVVVVFFNVGIGSQLPNSLSIFKIMLPDRRF